MDVHRYEARLEGLVRRVKNSSEISQENRRLILRFKDDCLLELSAGRTTRHVENIFRICRWMNKDLREFDKDDVKRIVAKLNSSPYSEWTRQFYRVSLRKFFKWLRGSEDYPEEVSWLKTTIRRNSANLPEVLNQAEVKRLIMSTSNARDRALIAVLYESGCRVGELLSLRIKDVEFDEHGAKLMLNGKGGMRRVRIVSYAPLLSEWINRHPLNTDVNTSLWTCFRGSKALGYQTVRKILKSAAKRAGIKKEIYPHLLRHSRATHLANHLTEAQMKEFFGWVQGSKMASVYVHLSGRDVDSAILSMYGLKSEVKRDEELSPKSCRRCKLVNPPTNKFCSRCGACLSLEVADEIIKRDMERRMADRILDKLIEDEEFREVLMRKVAELAKRGAS